MIRKLTAGLLAGVAAGCMVGPDYHAPKQSMPPKWDSPPTTQASVIVQQTANMNRWWTTFNDPELNSLIQRAMESNLDLEAAVERIHAARAAVGIATGGLLPTVDSSGGYTRSGGQRLQWSSQWTAGLNAAWEIDVFGGLRRSVESSDYSLDAAVEDRRDVLVTVLGEVATDYILLRSQQQQVAIAFENLEIQTRNAQLTRDKQKLGTGTDLDIVQADAQVATTTADLATLQGTAQQSIYALSVLLGRAPTDLSNELSNPAKVPDPPSEVPIGLPSDLLRRRPDIRRAERQLAAATADIGVATADLFPKFTLTGDVGLQARRIDLLSHWDNSFWSFGPGVTWSILDANRIRSRIDQQNAIRDQAVTTYRQTVLTALLQVQNVLVSYAQEQHRRVALSQAVDLNQRAVILATRRYKQGVDNFLPVLDAERALFGSQDALVQSNSAIGTDAVALYKALGGGWDIDSSEISSGTATTRPVNH